MTAATQIAGLAAAAARKLLERNGPYAEFFAREAERLAAACEEMSQRFLDGGRLIAFGRGVYATDAQHVSVEFVHPVIVGKRALPALDLSMMVGGRAGDGGAAADIAMGFGPPGGDPVVARALERAGRVGRDGVRAAGARWRLLGGARFGGRVSASGDHRDSVPHALGDSPRVFRTARTGVRGGRCGVSVPVPGRCEAGDGGVAGEVAASIRMKAADDARLRERAAREEADAIAQAAAAMGDAVRAGGKLILFGNGGSATDANDWALDCVAPPAGMRPVPAISLSTEPAVITALANDIGPDVIFLRQVIAHAQPGDVAVAISTSGGSRNLMSALEEARKRKLVTVALLGYDGGEVVRRGLADHAIVVRSDYVPRIQEVQASIYHTIRELLEVTALD